MSESKHSLQRIRHDLRGALSLIQLNLEALEALEPGGGGGSGKEERRKAVIDRVSEAVAEAVRLTDRLEATLNSARAERSG